MHIFLIKWAMSMQYPTDSGQSFDIRCLNAIIPDLWIIIQVVGGSKALPGHIEEGTLYIHGSILCAAY